MLSQVRSFIGKTPLKRNDCDLLSLTAAIVTDKSSFPLRSADPVVWTEEFIVPPGGIPGAFYPLPP